MEYTTPSSITVIEIPPFGLITKSRPADFGDYSLAHTRLCNLDSDVRQKPMFDLAIEVRPANDHCRSAYLVRPLQLDPD